MQNSRIVQYAFVHAVGATIYIALVALLMTNAEKLFDDTPAPDALIASAFLLTFVISAAVMGLTIFGRPAMWYLNGSKREAVTLALATVGFLVLFALILFTTLAFRAGR